MKHRRAQADARTSRARGREDPPDKRTHPLGTSLRILLIEDNQDHVILTRRVLEQRGHHVTASLGGADAIAALTAAEYDVVALDYQLPDATGLEVLQRIAERAGSLPVVMVTASGSEEVAVAALKSGARDYVIKTPGYERELARALELAHEQARAEAAEATLRTELEKRATTDCLTGLLNRGEMERVLKREMKRAARYHHSLSFALMDVDGFKAINDTFGHGVGDAVLRHLARVLQQATRASDSVARWGGDEFSVLLPEAGLEEARAVARRLQWLVEHPPGDEEEIPPITVSAGFASVHTGRPDLPTLLRWADRALYAAKAEGGGQAAFFVLTEGHGARLTAVMPGTNPEGDNPDEETPQAASTDAAVPTAELREPAQ